MIKLCFSYCISSPSFILLEDFRVRNENLVASFVFPESITNDVGKANLVFIGFQRYRKVQRLSNQVRELR